MWAASTASMINPLARLPLPKHVCLHCAPTPHPTPLVVPHLCSCGYSWRRASGSWRSSLWAMTQQQQPWRRGCSGRCYVCLRTSPNFPRSRNLLLQLLLRLLLPLHPRLQHPHRLARCGQATHQLQTATTSKSSSRTHCWCRASKLMPRCLPSSSCRHSWLGAARARPRPVRPRPHLRGSTALRRPRLPRLLQHLQASSALWVRCWLRLATR